MAQFQLRKKIAAPIDAVFDIFTDFAGAADVVPDILNLEMLTDGPVRVGTRFRETRRMMGREATEEMEVTRLEPNKTVTVSADMCGSRFDTTLHFESITEGTQVDMDFVCKPVTLSAKLMSPIGWLFMGTAKKAMEKDMDHLKQTVESRQPAGV